MSGKVSQKLSEIVQGLRFPNRCRPAQKSFSVPENFHKKWSSTRKAKVKDKIGQNDSDSSYETVAACGSVSCSVTSLEDELNFCYDSEEAITDGEDYSSIELPRDAGTSICDTSFDTLVHRKSEVVNDFSADPCEFFSKNRPLATSSPIKHSDPIVSSHYFGIEDFKDFKSFWNLTDEEKTIKDKPMISFISSSGHENQSSANPDVEDVNNISMLLHIPHPQDPEIYELDEVRRTLNKSQPINQEESCNKEAPESIVQLTNIKKSAIIHEYKSESKVEKKKHKDKGKGTQDIPVCSITVPPKHLIPKIIEKGKRREDIPICCITVPPKHPVPKIVVRGVIPAKKVLKHRLLQKKRLENIPVCCLALQAKNRKTIAHEQNEKSSKIFYRKDE